MLTGPPLLLLLLALSSRLYERGGGGGGREEGGEGWAGLRAECQGSEALLGIAHGASAAQQWRGEGVGLGFGERGKGWRGR